MVKELNDIKQIKELTIKREKAEREDTNTNSGQNEIHRILNAFNKRHAAIMVGGKFRILNEIKDPITEYPELTLSSISDFKNCYANWICWEKNRKPYAVIWLESPYRRQYVGFVFSPGKNIPGFYNLFKGLAIKPIRGDWSRFDDHISEVICGGDQNIYKWLKAWMADMVQNIGGERPGTAVVLRGRQGTGKGCFATQLGAIFGQHFLQITQPGQLTGRFNIHLASALLVYCDEAIWGGFRKDAGPLKGLITEDRLAVEPKGIDLYTVKNHMRLILATNSDWAIPADFEERRFLVLDVSDEHQKDYEYFKAIHNQMNNGGREAMLFDLLNMDISSINLRSVPRTAALFDQILKSLDSVGKFWFDKLKYGLKVSDYQGRTGAPVGDNDDSVFVRIENLHNDYLYYCKDMGLRHPEIVSQFSKRLRTLCPGILSVRKSEYGTKSTFIEFPPLKDCRHSFEERVGMEIDWGDDCDDRWTGSLDDGQADEILTH